MVLPKKTQAVSDKNVGQKENELDLLESLFTPPRAMFQNSGSPSSVSSIDSRSAAFVNFSSPVTPSRQEKTIQENLKKIFVSPSNSVKVTVNQIVNFLKSGETIIYGKEPYIFIKNHLLCPVCKIRTMKKKGNQIFCNCGTDFLSNFHRIEISHSIADVMNFHTETSLNSVEFVVLDNTLIMYCTGCNMIKKLE